MTGTSNTQLQSIIDNILDKSQLQYFKGIICRDEFTKLAKPWEIEYIIYNTVDSSSNNGHWVMWAKQNNKWYHFCPYGADPCKELIEYANAPIMSSTFQIQEFGETCCGEYCVLLIYLMTEGIDFQDAVLSCVSK